MYTEYSRVIIKEYEMPRKCITLTETEYDVIIDYANKNGLSFSEFVMKAVLDLIAAEEEMELATFLNKHLEFVSNEEQEEIDNMNIDFDNLSGEEMHVNDFL